MLYGPDGKPLEAQPIGSDNPTPNGQRDAEIEANQSKYSMPPALGGSEPHPTESQYTITREPEKDWWDKFKPWVELSGVLILGVYTFYTIKMYSANKQSADAAKVAADTAQRTLTQNVESFRIDERAWGVIDHISVLDAYPATHTFPVCWKYGIYTKNVGRTIARNVRIHIDQPFGSNITDQGIDLFQMKKIGASGNDSPSPQSLAPGE